MAPLQARLTNLLYQGYHSEDPKLKRVCSSLMGQWEGLWSFLRHDGVDPTNNIAEQAVRAGVIWRKTSFDKSEAGMRMIERLLNVAETAKKQGRELLEHLTSALTAQRTAQPAPALLNPA